MSSEPPVKLDQEQSAEAAPAWQPPRVSKAGGTSPQVERALSEVRAKIYPRSVSGIYARWRVIMVFVTQLIFYGLPRSEEHTSELQSLMSISYAAFCLKKKILHTYNKQQSSS